MIPLLLLVASCVLVLLACGIAKESVRHTTERRRMRRRSDHYALLEGPSPIPAPAPASASLTDANYSHPETPLLLLPLLLLCAVVAALSVVRYGRCVMT
jgi:hypothetical protein